jgi:ribosome-associated heat shock protein Hsp15
VNEERAKPAKALRVGDAIAIRKPPFEHAVIVKGLAEQRGSATVASLLFEETPESRARRTVLASEMKSMHAHMPRFKGRPTKKTRRDYEKWLRSPDEE